MSDYVWIRGDGQEVRLRGEQGMLSALYSGQVADDDLVRVPETGKWVRARDLKERIEASMSDTPFAKAHEVGGAIRSSDPMAGHAPPPRDPPDPGEGREQPEVGEVVRDLETQGWTQQNAPWRRYFARIVDFLVVAVVLGLAIGILFPNLMLADEGSFWFLVLILLSVPVVDGLFISRWHTSPGKWMLSVRTVPVSDGISFGAAYSRGWSMIMRGMWFSVPLLAMIPLTISYVKAAGGERLTWEKRYGTVTMVRGLGWPFLVFLLAMVAFAGLLWLDAMDQAGLL